MVATLVRSFLVHVVSLSVVGWQEGWRGTKPGGAGFGEAILMVLMVIIVNVAAVVIVGTLSTPLLANMPRDEWLHFLGGIIIRSVSIIFGLWIASILIQCAHNIGRRFYGLPLEPIVWINQQKKKPRRKNRQRKPRVQ
jgi:hypothetical protein